MGAGAAAAPIPVTLWVGGGAEGGWGRRGMMCAAAVAVATALVGAAAASPGRPNVIFTLVDDWGYNDVGYHNADNEGIISTPHMDRLSSSAHGIRLERFYSQPICTPTRSQTLTGRYQIHTGLQHGVLVRPSPCCCPCMPELLVIVRVRVGSGSARRMACR